MAQLYTLEPQTNAKVLLKTNFGDLELELWGAQAPFATRNFLQLCYDNYYNGTTFHRLVPGFILQGGDPTATGHGGEAIYPGGLFADEFHSRLKYNRRGLVGMANSGRKDDNGSQFFLTLGDTPELTGKNTMFGKIVGDTIYNLMRMGDLELQEGTERPLYPPHILATEVLVNPFEDIKPRETKRKAEEALEKKETKKAGKKKKAGRVLLSFAGDEEEVTVPIKKKPKFDTRVVIAASPEVEARKREEKKAQAQPPPITSLPKPKAPTPPPSLLAAATASRASRSPSPKPNKSASLLSKTNAQISALQKSLRRSISPPPAAPTTLTKPTSLLKLQKFMLPSTSIQGRKRRNNDSDTESFLALQRFRAKLASSTPPSGIPPPPPVSSAAPKVTADEGDDNGDDDEARLCDLHFIPNCESCGLAEQREDDGDVDTNELWSHTLSFEKDRRGKDLTWKKKNEELVVIDPREKQREILGKRGRGAGDAGSRRGENRRREERR